MKRSVMYVVAVCVMSVVPVVCGASAPGPTTWLDRPLDGTSLPFSPATGPVIVQAHASDADGVATLEFFVDDVSLGSVPGGGGRLGEASVEWNPTAAGTYTVRARAIDAEGNVGPEDTSVVVVSELTPASPTATLAITFAAPTLVVPSPTATRFIEVRVRPTATATPPREVQISLTADRTSLQPGECAMLEWSVQGGFGVELNGQPVERSGEKQVCPPETTIYKVAVDAGDRFEWKEIPISVASEAEPAPPPSGQVQVSLTADRTSLQPGECATLTWSVQGGFGVELNGQPVQRSGTQQVCPAETTVYKVAVDAGDRLEWKEVLISVASGAEPLPPEPPLPPGPGPQAPSPGQSGADVRPSDLFVQGGSVWTRITNDGHDTLSNNKVEVTLSGCGAGKQYALNIAPGQTQTIDTGCQAAAGSNSYSVSVKAIDFTDPNSANNTYSETLEWGGAPPPPPPPPGITPPAGPSQPSSVDLAITDLFPQTLHGPVYGRITNRGPGGVSNLSIQFSCRWTETDAIEGIQKSNQVGPRNITISSLSPGQTTEFNTNISVELQQFQYDMTCTLHGPANDPNMGNNTYSEEISR